LSFKVILNLKNTLRLIETNKTTKDNKDITLNNYNNNTIIINISYKNNKKSEI